MIDKFSGTYSLVCDICGEEADEQFFDFYDAVQYKKDNGWKSQKRNGEWEDVCPECQGSDGEHDEENIQTNVKCRYCNSKNVEVIARGIESILYKCKACKMEFAKLNIRGGLSHEVP